MSKTKPIALITGASRGLGAASAKIFAQSGFHIIALARTIGALEELDDSIQNTGASTTLVPADISDLDVISDVCASVYQRWGGLNLWLHTAIHAAPLSPVGHIDTKDFAKSLSANLTATQHLIACIDPLLRAKKGLCIYCKDPVAGKKFFGAYGASKAAQSALFESWAAENTNGGIDVMGFTPKPMPTATRARFHPSEPRDALSSTENQAAELMALVNR